MHSLGFRRYRFVGSGGGYEPDDDIAVPLIDGRRLCDRWPGDLSPGIDVALVLPPSRHLHGEPEYVGYGRTVLLDGGCGDAECCGLIARVTVGKRVVRWDDLYCHGGVGVPAGLVFEFDRDQYEGAIADFDEIAVEPWSGAD